MAARRPSTARPRRRQRGHRLWRWLVGLVGAGLVLGLGSLAAAYALTSIPDPNDLAEAQVSTVYYSDGTTVLGHFNDVDANRVPVTIDQVPVPVQRAVLAAEDRGFYENRGVSPTGIARALWNNVRGESTQGGSTITQQYVKNYFLNADQTYTRKFKEFIIALKVDQQQTKDETLADYLNTVYFGRGAYGIQTAARAYFDKDVEQLDVAEGALLAGLLAAPSAYDPRSDAAAAERRWDYVMDGMVQEGWLSAAERASATMPETVEPRRRSADYEGPEGHLLATVRNELESTIGLSDTEIDRRGLRIVTTFDAAAQAAAVEAVRETLPESAPAQLQVGLVSIDPATGGVRALYGGPDFLANQYNTVTQGTAQAGSTFKPFTLVAALEEGIGLRSTYSGRSPMKVDGWDKPVNNFGGASQGRIDLLTATAKSTNTVYAQLNDDVTPAATREVAVRAGIPEDTTDLNDFPSNVLGPAATRPVDIAQAYTTLAAQGVKRQWHTVASITDATGVQTYVASPLTQRVFSEDVMADTTYALQQVVRRGSGSWAQRLDRPVAGKTGTSSNNMSAWFAGYTPQLATVVAMYQNDERGLPVPLRIGSREVTGGSFPVRIWTSYMQDALQGQEELDFPEPQFVGKSRGSSGSGTSSQSRSSSTTSSTTSPSESGTSTPSQPDDSSSSASPGDSASTSPSAGSGSGRSATSTGSPSPSSASEADADPSSADQDRAARTGEDAQR